MPPLVSVVIPAYNHEAFIGEAIASVLDQSLEDFELIVIDDGSTDATREKIKAFTDPRLTFLAQENRGAAATLNRGLERARGRYLSILNSDDRYHPERLRKLTAALRERSGTRLAVSAVEVIDPAGRPAAAEWLERGLAYYRKSGDLFAAVIRDNFICTSSNLLFDRELLQKTGPFLPLRYCHDLDFILQARLDGEIFFSGEKLLAYRVHETNTIKEITARGGELFLFEVAVVIACALAERKVPATEIAAFTEELLDTQLGSLLDLVGLLGVFFSSQPAARACLRSWLERPEDAARSALLEFIAARNARHRRPWELYQATLSCYEENRKALLALERTNREIWEQSQGFAARVAELNEELAERERRLAEQAGQLAEQAGQIESLKFEAGNLKTILDEIYRSRGWLWLTRYRKMVDLVRGLGKR